MGDRKSHRRGGAALVRAGRFAVGALVALALAACATRGHSQQPARNGRLELRFLDVGQGDGILIRNGGKTVLVDASETDGIATQLRALGVTGIDLAVASHNDNDHIGGMDAVLSTFPVRYYLDNAFPKTTRIQRRVLDLVHEHNVQYLQPTARTIELGDARLVVLPPGIPQGGSQNDHSVGLLLERGAFKALLTGDSERRELAAWLREADIPDVDVFKAPHHGARNAFLQAWLNRTRPEVVVISVGLGNDYGHPHAEALRGYGRAAHTVLRTDVNGAVTVTVDAAGCYEVRAERRGSAPVARGGPASCPTATEERTP